MAKYHYRTRAKGTSPQQQSEWREKHGPPAGDSVQTEHLLALVAAIREAPDFSPDTYDRIVRQLARQGYPILPKARLRRGVKALMSDGVIPHDDLVLRRLQMKPTRTQSGVAPVTVLTGPYPCPGECIFCPDDVRMPKSYLANEPGAMRALMLEFDPFRQVSERIAAMRRIGHTTDKIELLILGGTWSVYPKRYQAWFIRRCFDAMNHPEEPGDGAEGTLDEELSALVAAQVANETAPYRNVGLVIETRPDRVTVEEVRWLRRLGVTRVQLGVQSLDDDLLTLNKRGHTVADARRAMRLLRGAGFKVAIHWMPNLLGATLEGDQADFARWWDDPALRPDEMKIYPTGLLRDTVLYDHYEQGDYVPYTEGELLDLLVACKRMVPPYCRLNRVMRDIPAPEIADGVTTSNLRQVVQARLREAGTPCKCIRCAEVRREHVDPAQVRIEALRYDTDHSREVFLGAYNPEGRLAGFLRLSLPSDAAPLPELDGVAIIRQVQVYGPVVALEDASNGHAQHQGLGRMLIEESFRLSRGAGFQRIAVIAAVGTRRYYRKLGFELDDLYMSRKL